MVHLLRDTADTCNAQPTCPKTESTMGRSFLLSPSFSQRSSGSPTGEDRLKVLALGFGGLFILAELHRLSDSIFFLMEPWRKDKVVGMERKSCSTKKWISSSRERTDWKVIIHAAKITIEWLTEWTDIFLTHCTQKKIRRKESGKVDTHTHLL